MPSKIWPDDEEPDDIAAVRKLFTNRLPGHVAVLETCWSRLVARPDASVQDAIRKMFRIAHDLSGTAGAFGAERLGDAAVVLARELRPYIDGTDAIPTETVRGLEPLIGELKATAIDYISSSPGEAGDSP